ncbi:MAG: hypothetical protein ABI854_02565 [Betaproteobacteria bacterium]
MNSEHTESKLTDELERRLIQREIDSDAHRNAGPSVYVLEIVVGSLLLLGMLALATRFG